MTLAAGAVLAVALVVALSGRPGVDAGRAEARLAAAPLPPVAAAPPPASDELLAPLVPRHILERLPDSRAAGPELADSSAFDPSAAERLVEWVDPGPGYEALPGPLRVEYSIDVALTEAVAKIARRERVVRGHVLVMDTRSGRVVAYVSTDPDGFPATRPYPAASLVKVITAAAALDEAPEAARSPCRYRGSPYRLTRSRLDPPARGNQMSLARALATSNNQCFAQLAVNAIGGDALRGAIARFGWLERPAPGHAPGRVSDDDDAYQLGRLGCGLGGCRITPLHALQLAGALVDGERIEPWWIDRVVDANGRSLTIPRSRERRRVMSADLAHELRQMLVATVTRGTARSAFRDRRGRPKLGDVRVAGKTGNLTGSDPYGRYEWFAGVAPAADPSIAIAVLQVHSDLWWVKSSEVAADVLAEIFCERGRCTAANAARYTGAIDGPVGPAFLSTSFDASRDGPRDEDGSVGH